MLHLVGALVRGHDVRLAEGGKADPDPALIEIVTDDG